MAQLQPWGPQHEEMFWHWIETELELPPGEEPDRTNSKLLAQLAQRQSEHQQTYNLCEAQKGAMTRLSDLLRPQMPNVRVYPLTTSGRKENHNPRITITNIRMHLTFTPEPYRDIWQSTQVCQETPDQITFTLSGDCHERRSDCRPHWTRAIEIDDISSQLGLKTTGLAVTDIPGIVKKLYHFRLPAREGVA